MLADKMYFNLTTVKDYDLECKLLFDDFCHII